MKSILCALRRSLKGVTVAYLQGGWLAGLVADAQSSRGEEYERPLFTKEEWEACLREGREQGFSTRDGLASKEEM